MAKAKSTYSKTGLLIVERHCDLTVGMFVGVKREEFVRFIVLNDAGVKSASISVNDQQRARVESIQARTIAPGGGITEADSKKDIHTFEVGAFKSKQPLESIARVDFPAPAVGAILDLHFVTVFQGWTVFYADPVTFGEHPALKTDFVIRAHGGFSGTQWSLTLLGGRAGMGHLVRKPDDVIEASFGPMLPGKDEPSSVPFTQRDTALLLYLEMESSAARIPGKQVGYHADVDARGRPVGIDWNGVSTKQWWQKYLKKDKEAVEQFLRHPGRAKDAPVETLAPASLPLEERVDKLYRYAQSTLTYNPDAKDHTNLADTLREGERFETEGNLYFAYLLERAGIAHTCALVADRWSVRLNPIITNDYIYGFTDAVFVDIPQKGRQFYMAGELALPAGSLPDGHQDSVAIWSPDGKDIQACFTPLNPPGVDRTEYRYEALVAANGSAVGKVTISKWGTAASDLLKWYKIREYHRAHPSSEDKKKRLSPQEEKSELDKRLREDADVPGKTLDMTDVTLTALPSSSLEPLKLSCAFTSKATGQPTQGGMWVVDSAPMLAGYENPFVAAARETPIWFSNPGRVVMDGILLLPAGAKVSDVPGDWQFSGPEGAIIRVDVEAGQKDGLSAVQSHLEYDRPIIVSRDNYAVWKVYEESLVSRGESHCLASWPVAKVLE